MKIYSNYESIEFFVSAKPSLSIKYFMEVFSNIVFYSVKKCISSDDIRTDGAKWDTNNATNNSNKD